MAMNIRAYFTHWLYKRVFCSYGPVMVQVRDYWLYIDEYGRMWKLQRSYDWDRHCPLVITCEREP